MIFSTFSLSLVFGINDLEKGLFSSFLSVSNDVDRYAKTLQHNGYLFGDCNGLTLPSGHALDKKQLILLI